MTVPVVESDRVGPNKSGGEKEIDEPLDSAGNGNEQSNSEESGSD